MLLIKLFCLSIITVVTASVVVDGPYRRVDDVETSSPGSFGIQSTVDGLIDSFHRSAPENEQNEHIRRLYEILSYRHDPNINTTELDHILYHMEVTPGHEVIVDRAIEYWATMQNNITDVGEHNVTDSNEITKRRILVDSTEGKRLRRYAYTTWYNFTDCLGLIGLAVALGMNAWINHHTNPWEWIVVASVTLSVPHACWFTFDKYVLDEI